MKIWLIRKIVIPLRLFCNKATLLHGIGALADYERKLQEFLFTYLLTIKTKKRFMKKIFTLLTLALLSIGSAWAYDSFTITFNGKNAQTTDGYFSWNTAKHNFNSKFTDATYDGTKYTSGLKMEGTTNVSFTSTVVADVIIVQSTWSDKTIKFDGTELVVADAESGTGCRIYTIEDVAAGDHSITRGSGESGLFLIQVNYKEEDPTPTLGASPAKVTLKATPWETTVSTTATISGSYLTDGTYNLTIPAVEGLSVSPKSITVEDGAVAQELTITYTSTEDVAEATTNIVATVGEMSATVEVTYSSKADMTSLKSVSASTTWDFSEVTGSLQHTSNAAKTTEIVYADLDGISFGEGFDASTISFKGEYPIRNKMCQNGVLKFNTTLAGTIKVDFSDTGSSGSGYERYLNVNDTNTEYYTMRSGKSNDKQTGAEVNVSAGDVTITGMKDDGETPAAICIYKVVFTATATDAIQTVKAADADAAAYNLAGQKVAAGYKGIAVKNGKKVVVK